MAVSDRSIQHVPGILSQHKFKMVLTFLVVMTLVVLYTLFWPRSYESQGEILMKLGRENVALDPTASIGKGSVVAIPQTREDEINSVVSILDNRHVAEQIVDEFGPATILNDDGALEDEEIASLLASNDTEQEVMSEGMDEQLKSALEAERKKHSKPIVDIGAILNMIDPVSQRERAIIEFSKSLKVDSKKKTNVVELSYKTYSPVLAQAVVQKVMDNYLKEHARVHRTVGSHEFFNTQAEELKLQLTNAENEYLTFKNNTGIASIASQKDILIQRIGRLEDEVLAVEADLAVNQAEVNSLEEKLQKQPEKLITEQTEGHTNEAADGMRERLYELQIREQELLSRYKEDMFMVKAVRREIAEAQKILKGEEGARTQVTTGINKTFSELQLLLLTKKATLEALLSRKEKLWTQLTEAREEKDAINDQELKMKQMEREIQLKETQYREYATSLEQARIDQALEMGRISNISITQQASLQEKPVWPRKGICLALGLILSTCCSIAVAMGFDVMRSAPASNSSQTNHSRVTQTSTTEESAEVAQESDDSQEASS